MAILAHRTNSYDPFSDLLGTYRKLSVRLKGFPSKRIMYANAVFLVQNTGKEPGQYHFSDEEIFTAIEPALKRLSGSDSK